MLSSSINKHKIKSTAANFVMKYIWIFKPMYKNAFVEDHFDEKSHVKYTYKSNIIGLTHIQVLHSSN